MYCVYANVCIRLVRIASVMFMYSVKRSNKRAKLKIGLFGTRTAIASFSHRVHHHWDRVISTSFFSSHTRLNSSIKSKRARFLLTTRKIIFHAKTAFPKQINGENVGQGKEAEKKESEMLCGFHWTSAKSDNQYQTWNSIRTIAFHWLGKYDDLHIDFL